LSICKSKCNSKSNYLLPAMTAKIVVFNMDNGISLHCII